MSSMNSCCEVEVQEKYSLSLDPTTVDFGTVPLGTESEAQVVVLRNSGWSTINIQSFEVSSGFAIKNSPVSLLQPQQEVEIELTAFPSSPFGPGLQKGWLQVDGGKAGVVSTELSATGGLEDSLWIAPEDYIPTYGSESGSDIFTFQTALTTVLCRVSRNGVFARIDLNFNGQIKSGLTPLPTYLTVSLPTWMVPANDDFYVSAIGDYGTEREAYVVRPVNIDDVAVLRIYRNNLTDTFAASETFSIQLSVEFETSG